MGNITDRIARLSPEKREILLQQLEIHQSQMSRRQAEQGLVTGAVPLLPAQIQLLTMMSTYKLDYHVFNLSTLLEIDYVIDDQSGQRAVQHLLEHHDALRIRLKKLDTEWYQWIDEPGEAAPFHVFDFSSLSSNEQQQAIEKTCAQFQQSLNLSVGPVFRIVYFNLGSASVGRLLFLVHHFASDAFSQRVIIEDFITAYQQCSRQEPIQLPPKTASIKQRAECLLSYASSPQLHSELAYWLHLPWSEVTALPIDYPEHMSERPRAKKIERTLSQKETRALLYLHPRSGGRQVQRRLLTALVSVFTTWMQTRALVISMHHHGRLLPFEDLDFSRTVGWLTCNPRLLLTAAQPGASIHELFQSLNEQLDQVPNEGIGYELLRHLSVDEQTTHALKALPGPSIAFDHLGQYNTPADLRQASEAVGDGSPLSHLWKNDLHMITTEVVDEQLWLQWEYSETVYRQETIETLLEHVLTVLGSMNF